MSNHMRIAVLAVASTIGSATSVYAEPGGTSGVSGPSVAQGDFEIEFRTTTFTGDALDGDWAHRAQISYAFTDWWRPTLILRASQPDNGSAEVRSIGIENVFDYAPSRDWPVHLGGQFEYKFGLNGADDDVVLKLLAERRRGPFTARLNLIGERAVGTSVSEDWEHAYAARVTWRSSDNIVLGVEGFGEPAGGAHYWGPRAGLSFGDATLSVAYLAGFENAQADGQFRLALEFEP